MNKLFPISRITLRQLALDGTPLKERTAPEINLKVKVVCAPCNNRWMSRLENDFAKPAMTDLILGNRIGEISKRRAHGLSLFAFKTAVIGNRSLPETEWFFDRSERHTFKNSLTIPSNVSMYIFGVADSFHGMFLSRNVSYPDLSLNICTFCIGHLGFQVVSGKAVRLGNFQSIPTPPGLVDRFYPTLDQTSWPRKTVLGIQAFNDFAARWNSIRKI
ncbi:MAG: hypothetical protein WCA15_16470 [Candidatus Acidiferrales bacterium]